MVVLQLSVLLALTRNALAVNNGLARTPQMGWVGQASAAQIGLTCC